MTETYVENTNVKMTSLMVTVCLLVRSQVISFIQAFLQPFGVSWIMATASKRVFFLENVIALGGGSTLAITPGDTAWNIMSAPRISGVHLEYHEST